MSGLVRQAVRLYGKSVLLILLLNGLFATYLLIKPGFLKPVTLVDNLVQALLEGIGLLITLPIFLRRNRRADLVREKKRLRFLAKPDHRWVPVLLSLGLLSYVIGQVLWTYNEDIAHLQVLFPSWADAGYLGSYPLVLLAILLLPSRPLPAAARTRIFLDGLMVMSGIVTFSWYFTLGPTLLQGSDSLLGQIVSISYPLATLVLICCMLVLFIRSHDHAFHPAMMPLVLGLLIIVSTDSIYSYQQLHNSYATGGLLDIGWPLGYMCIGLSARAMRLYSLEHPELSSTSVSSFTPQTSEPLPSLWGSLLPYAFVPAVGILWISIAHMGETTLLERGVFAGGIALIGLVVLRQVIALREAHFYNMELRRTQQDVQKKNQALSEVNSQLEEQAAQLTAAYEQLCHVNELKDQFLLNVNHELRTPLTEICGYLSLLQEYNGHLDTKTQATFLTHAAHGSEQLLQLVNNVLDAIRGDVLGRTPLCENIAVATVVRSLLEMFEPQKRLDYHLTLDIPETLVIKADQQYFRRVLLNLLSNAFKYSPKDTTVTVSAKPCEVQSEGASQEGNSCSQVSICVQDAGLGIPPSDIPLLFSKFVRLRRDLVGSVRGTGLGLYISKQLVEAMGGRIWVESSGIPGEGSRFYIALPSAPLPNAPPPDGEVQQTSDTLTPVPN